LRIYVGGSRGGTGKSTVAVYLFKRLKEMGHRVGFRDLSQNLIGEALMKAMKLTPDPDPEFEIYDLRSGTQLDHGDVEILVTEFPYLSLDLEETNSEEERLREEMRSQIGETKPRRVLVVNKVSPVPEDMQEQVRKVRELAWSFDHVVIVPFNGNLFYNNLEGEPTLDVLAEILAGKRGDKFVYPLAEPMHRRP